MFLNFWKCHWWARYHSKCVFGHFQWFARLVRPSDTMYNLETIVGCVPSPLALMRCHSDHFRLIQPILTFFDVFMLFSMFAYLYRTDYYIARLSMRFPYYSIPMRCISDLIQPILAFFSVSLLISDLSLHWWTIYAFSYYSPIWCVSNLLRPFVVFTYFHSYRYSDVLVIYSFCWLHYCYRFGRWSLRTISHIRSLWHHFHLSEVIFTYILLTTPIFDRITLYLVPSTS